MTAARVTRQYDMVFLAANPITNVQANRFLEVADEFVIVERTPLGAMKYRFTATTNANLDEFLAIVNTIISPNVFTPVTINTNPISMTAP
jgi:hypothetical protein